MTYVELKVRFELTKHKAMHYKCIPVGHWGTSAYINIYNYNMLIFELAIIDVRNNID